MAVVLANPSVLTSVTRATAARMRRNSFVRVGRCNFGFVTVEIITAPFLVGFLARFANSRQIYRLCTQHSGLTAVGPIPVILLLSRLESHLQARLAAQRR